MITRDAAIAIAYDWHAGQDSSLYAFAKVSKDIALSGALR